MELFKTTILPIDDPNLAKQIFTRMVKEQPLVLLVVVGKSDDINDLVQLGDKLAGGNRYDTWRRVVWVRDDNQRENLFEGLDLCEGVSSPQDSDVAAFFIDIDNKVCETIMANDLPATKGRILRGFIIAEAGA
jgi:hypothetical protein